METKTFYLKLTLIVVVAAMMTACGASKSSNSDSSLSSRLSPTETTTTTTDRPIALCNQKAGSLISLGLSVYKDGESYVTDRVNAKILKVPSVFSQKNNYIEFHKYMVNTSGSKIWGDQRITFSIYSIADGKNVASGLDVLYWADLENLAQNVGASTPEQFFKKVRMVLELEDYEGEYDVVVARYYNATDDSLLEAIDELIPAFDADPTKYKYEKDGSIRHSSLQSLHPFKSSINQGWTASTYQTKANDFCKPLYSTQ